MNTVSVNVVVDVQQSLSPRKSMTLAKEITQIRGVNKAQLSHHSARLMLVDFDVTITEARHILDAFRGQGYDARLIGM